MEKLVYQMFILGTGGVNNIKNLYTALEKGLGGVIFFTNDIQSENQIIEDIKNVKQISSIQPFVSIDQEGGRVERTENIRPKRLSARNAFEQGKDFLKEQVQEISTELASWGFNLNFAPCIDVNTNPNNPIIGERAFADNTDDVIAGMDIFVDASRKYNVIPCVKHFPGHGDADKDSHLTLPNIKLTLNEMEEKHIKPFKSAVQKDIEMIMVAHLHCTCFDDDVIPTSLSKNAVGYLRNVLDFDGVLITDDMNMQGVQDFGSVEACIMAIKAGVDMFIFRSSDDKTLQVIEALAAAIEQDEELKEKVKKSNQRILELKQKYGIV